jgi:hypothetical protein
MSSDPLARSDIWAGAPNEAEYDAVYAAVMATERGRWFLAEYAGRNRQADTQTLAGALARIEAAIRNDRPEPAPMPDLAGAVERIQDVAFSLRERAEDPALCDALDAAAREISEASRSVNGEESARDTNALLRDLVGQVDRLALSVAASKSVEPAVATGAAIVLSSTELPSAELTPPKLSSVELSSAGAESETASKANGAAANGSLPPLSYEPAAEPSSAKPDDQRRRWYIEPPDFAFVTPTRTVEPSKESVEAPKENGHASALLPGPRLMPGPQDDPADLFEPAAAVVTPTVRAASRSAAPDPLAGVRSLSEEEIIALFS